MCLTNPQKDLKGGKGNERFSITASERLLFWIFDSLFTAVNLRYAPCAMRSAILRLAPCSLRHAFFAVTDTDTFLMKNGPEKSKAEGG
jgi:hypothetical protein